jgi:hypothetical protein
MVSALQNSVSELHAAAILSTYATLPSRLIQERERSKNEMKGSYGAWNRHVSFEPVTITASYDGNRQISANGYRQIVVDCCNSSHHKFVFRDRGDDRM